jgi:hypothetical protein
MRNSSLAMMVILASAALSTGTRAQTRSSEAPTRSGISKSHQGPVLLDGWGRPVVDDLKPGEKPGPAPYHDISGTWAPAESPIAGDQPTGAKAMPNDGKPEHTPPYTPLGLRIQESHKPLIGYGSVVPALSNDPRNICDPMGFPRADLYGLRHTQIMQDAHKIAILYEFGKRWRVIWIDGRKLPKEIPQPQYYGYSVGKWVDATTLVVNTVGLVGDGKTWVDDGGRPQSDAMHVVERFHRVNHDRMELTVTLDDPKMYTKPWIAMNKFPLRLDSPDYGVIEQMCIPSEQEQYYRDIGNLYSGVANGQTKQPEQEQYYKNVHKPNSGVANDQTKQPQR